MIFFGFAGILFCSKSISGVMIRMDRHEEASGRDAGRVFDTSRHVAESLQRVWAPISLLLIVINGFELYLGSLSG